MTDAVYQTKVRLVGCKMWSYSISNRKNKQYKGSMLNTTTLSSNSLSYGEV